VNTQVTEEEHEIFAPVRQKKNQKREIICEDKADKADKLR
jgi:hypothetical protein